MMTHDDWRSEPGNPNPDDRDTILARYGFKPYDSSYAHTAYSRPMSIEDSRRYLANNGADWCDGTEKLILIIESDGGWELSYEDSGSDNMGDGMPSLIEQLEREGFGA